MGLSLIRLQEGPGSVPAPSCLEKLSTRRSGKLIQASCIHFLMLLLYCMSSSCRSSFSCRTGISLQAWIWCSHTHGRRSLPGVVPSQMPKGSCTDKGTLPRGHPHSAHLRRDLLEGHSGCRRNFQYLESVWRRDDSRGGYFCPSATEGADETSKEPRECSLLLPAVLGESREGFACCVSTKDCWKM